MPKSRDPELDHRHVSKLKELHKEDAPFKVDDTVIYSDSSGNERTGKIVVVMKVLTVRP